MYLHRIALSVILPPPPPRSDDHVIPANLQGAATPLLAIREKRTRPPTASEASKMEKRSTLPAKKGSIIVPAVQRMHRNLGDRTRSESLKLPSEGAATGKPKAIFKKQRSLLSDIGRARDLSAGSETPTDTRRSDPGSSDKVAGEIQAGMHWKGLQLDLLRGRIQRLMVLLNTSVPGTVPDPNMLASLVDLVRTRALPTLSVC